MSNSLKAIDVLSTKGFIIPSKPTYEIPALPRDITDLNDDDLMELFVELTSWNDYVAPQLAVAAIDEREADRYVSVLEATAMVNHWKGASGERVTIAKANIVIDPKVIEAKEELDSKYAYRKLIETLLQNLERDTALVSRELTRRTANSGVANRARKYTA